MARRKMSEINASRKTYVIKVKEGGKTYKIKVRANDKSEAKRIARQEAIHRSERSRGIDQGA